MENKFTGRVTCRKLVDWLNKEFERLEIKGVTVSKVEPTRFSSEQHQGGARHLRIEFYNNSSPENTGDFSCFYPIWYLQKVIDSGGNFRLSFQLTKYNLGLIKDLEIEIIN